MVDNGSAVGEHGPRPMDVSDQFGMADAGRAQWMKKQRLTLGWSQERAAQWLGVGLRGYQRWEAGDRPVVRSVILGMKLALALHHGMVTGKQVGEEWP